MARRSTRIPPIRAKSWNSRRPAISSANTTSIRIRAERSVLRHPHRRTGKESKQRRRSLGGGERQHKRCRGHKILFAIAARERRGDAAESKFSRRTVPAALLSTQYPSPLEGSGTAPGSAG